MRQRSFIVLAVALVVLVAGAVGVYAYDRGRDDVIAKGVAAGGVDLSGMKPAEARATLARKLVDPLQRAVVVTYGRHHFQLTPKRARVRIDTDGMVRQALDASRSGNILSRTTRAITGGRVHVRIPVDVAYSQSAVDHFTRHVQRSVDQPGRDASITFAGAQIEKVDSRTGRRLDTEALKRRVQTELVQQTADHRVRATVRRTPAKVTTAELAKKYPTVIIVNRGGFQLTLYKHLRVARTYRIAVGRQGLETPAGRYSIQDKQVNPSWHVPNSAWAGSLAGRVIPPGPADPIKARWMGIAGGAGIHGTDEVGSLGSAASHGCIRMAIPDVIALFDQVNVGDPVFIA